MAKRSHLDDTTDSALAELKSALADLAAVAAVVNDRAQELIDYVEQGKGDDAR